MIKKNQYLKRQYAFVLTAVILLAVFLFFRATIGAFLWEKARAPQFSLFVYPDAVTALKIGNYYFGVGQDGVYELVQAEKYFKRALMLDPQVSDAWHQLARIDFLQRNFIGALEKINKQIEIHGDSFMASYYVRGLINGYLKNFEQAEADFKKFLEWDNTNWAVHNDLAWIYFQKGEFENAEKITRRGLGFAPNNAWLLTSLGVSLLNLDKKGEAKLYLLKAKDASEKLTEADWQKAYPGNNPLWSQTGLGKMRETIEFNLNLVK